MLPPIATVLALFVSLATPVPTHQPAPHHIKPEPIAAAAKHPGPLEVEEEATSELSKGFGKAIWAASISSADGSFGHADVLLVEGGSFLGAATRQRFDAAIAAPEETFAALAADLERQLKVATHEEDRARIRREIAALGQLRGGRHLARAIALPHGNRGYVSLLGFGPSGATFVAVMPSPDGRFDLIVLTGGGLESARRTPTAASAPYEDAMQHRPLDVTEAIGVAVSRQLFPPPDPTPSAPGAER
jgi:hypothetical protein